MNVIIGNHADLNKSLAEINDHLDDLEELSALLTLAHKKRLAKLAGKDSQSTRYTVSEVDKQFELVNKIRDQVLDDHGSILEGTDVRELASLVSSINALVGLFLKSEGLLDHAREKAELQDAVYHAISGLDKEAQAVFFSRLEGNL